MGVLHDYAGKKDPRRAECGVLTDSLAGYSHEVTCKRCLAVRAKNNRRLMRHASVALFAVVGPLRLYGNARIAEEVRALAVSLHNRSTARFAADALEG